MIAGMLGMFATLATVVLLLAGIGIRTHLDWRLKAVVIVATAAVLVGCYLSLLDLLGWPTPFHPGDRDWVLIHAVVSEPDRRGGDEGDIFLWVRADSDPGAPRALQFPYRRDLHESVVAALRRQAGGIVQGVRTSSGGNPGAGGSFSIHDLHKPKPAEKDDFR